MTAEHHSVVTRNEMVSYEEYMHPIARTLEEMDDGECLMLCSGQHKGRMLERISTGTS